ncbi:MAG: hypothetical protein WBN90_10195 [Gammaproteobacteria bacterium]
MKPLAFALGAAFATTLPVANAADNPFAMTELSSGLMMADASEGKCGEGKCGGSKQALAIHEYRKRCRSDGRLVWPATSGLHLLRRVAS